MTYIKETFTGSTVLTASHCNQIEENIVETRTLNIGSGPPSSTVLLPGNLWTKTASTEWIMNILQGSSAAFGDFHWVPFAKVDTSANSLATMRTDQFVTNNSGACCVSSEPLIVGSLSNVNSAYDIGPSGSYWHNWTPLDEIPKDIDWIQLRTTIIAWVDSTATDMDYSLSAATYQGSTVGGTPLNDYQTIAKCSNILSGATVTSFRQMTSTCTAKVPVNSDNAFELRPYASASISSMSGWIYLVGYGIQR